LLEACGSLAEPSGGVHEAGETPRRLCVASNGTWAAVDRIVTNLAPWVPIMNPREAVVVSRRVGNVQANTEWGVLIDQLWVK
jgi:hypothetical protein